MINYHYYTEQEIQPIFWASYVYANGDLIKIYSSCATKLIADQLASAFIDGIKFGKANKEND